MLMPTRYDIDPHICDKLMTLLGLIHSEKDLFNHIASFTSDRHLRDSILMLAQSTNQFSNELFAHMQTLGINPKVQNTSIEPAVIESLCATGEQSGLEGGKSLLCLCCEREKKLVMVYRDILNEPYLPKESRTMLRQQLNGITYSFVQVKLLRMEYV